MSKYAFLVHGDEGEYETINDRIRMRRYGAWLIAEKIQQDKLAKHQARQILSAVQLAKRIAAKENITVEQAFDMLNNQGDADSALMLSDYLNEARDMMEGGMSRNEQDAKLITIFMRTRGEGLLKGKWSSLQDWSEGDTEILDEVLRDRIMNFILGEQSGGDTPELDEDAVDQVEQVEESEGNLPNGTEPSENASESLTTKTTGTPVTAESPLVV